MRAPRGGGIFSPPRLACPISDTPGIPPVAPRCTGID